MYTSEKLLSPLKGQFMHIFFLWCYENKYKIRLFKDDRNSKLSLFTFFIHIPGLLWTSDQRMFHTSHYISCQHSFVLTSKSQPNTILHLSPNNSCSYIAVNTLSMQIFICGSTVPSCCREIIMFLYWRYTETVCTVKVPRRLATATSAPLVSCL